MRTPERQRPEMATRQGQKCATTIVGRQKREVTDPHWRGCETNAARSVGGAG